MGNFTDTLKRFTDGWRKLKTTQQILIIGIIVIAIILVGVISTLLGQVNYVGLFPGSTLSQDEAGAIYDYLTEQQVEIRTENNVIMVPEDQAAALRMELAAQGMPSSTAGATTGLNNSLYMDNAMAFGATAEDKQRIYQFQAEDKLTAMINNTAKVKQSAVMLNPVIQSEWAFDDSNEAFASATIGIEPLAGQSFTEEDANMIRELVSGAVTSLEPENVTVVNNSTMEYYSGSDMSAGGGATAAAKRLDMEMGMSNQFKTQIMNLLSPVFGPERISANVNVRLNFDKHLTESITLTPVTEIGEAENIGGIVSRNREIERILYGDAAEGIPGMDPNGGAPVYQVDQAELENSVYYKTVESINAEMNEVREQIEQAEGKIEEMSATVILDNTDQNMDDVLEQVRTQISTAVGIPLNLITVSAMPFEQNTLLQQRMVEQAEALERVERNNLIQRIITIGGVLGGIIIVITLIMNTLKKRKEMELEAQRMKWLEEQERRPVDLVADEMISIDDIMGQDEAGTLGQLQALVSRNPEGIAQILRNWLMDDFSGRR